MDQLARKCGECTKCCEGWLSANVRGHEMYPGKPCFFVQIGKGCKDYDNRPEDPCKVYSCMWLKNLDIPEEFSPLKTGVIVDFQKRENGIEFLSLTKAPNDPSLELLSWAAVYAVSNGYNLSWQLGEKTYWFGTKDFSEYMTSVSEAGNNVQNI